MKWVPYPNGLTPVSEDTSRDQRMREACLGLMPVQYINNFTSEDNLENLCDRLITDQKLLQQGVTALDDKSFMTLFMNLNLNRNHIHNARLRNQYVYDNLLNSFFRLRSERLQRERTTKELICKLLLRKQRLKQPIDIVKLDTLCEAIIKRIQKDHLVLGNLSTYPNDVTRQVPTFPQRERLNINDINKLQSYLHEKLYWPRHTQVKVKSDTIEARLNQRRLSIQDGREKSSSHDLLPVKPKCLNPGFQEMLMNVGLQIRQDTVNGIRPFISLLTPSASASSPSSPFIPKGGGKERVSSPLSKYSSLYRPEVSSSVSDSQPLDRPRLQSKYKKLLPKETVPLRERQEDVTEEIIISDSTASHDLQVEAIIEDAIDVEPVAPPHIRKKIKVRRRPSTKPVVGVSTVPTDCGLIIPLDVSCYSTTELNVPRIPMNMNKLPDKCDIVETSPEEHSSAVSSSDESSSGNSIIILIPWDPESGDDDCTVRVNIDEDSIRKRLSSSESSF